MPYLSSDRGQTLKRRSEEETDDDSTTNHDDDEQDTGDGDLLVVAKHYHHDDSEELLSMLAISSSPSQKQQQDNDRGSSSAFGSMSSEQQHWLLLSHTVHEEEDEDVEHIVSDMNKQDKLAGSFLNRSGVVHEYHSSCVDKYQDNMTCTDKKTKEKIIVVLSLEKKTLLLLLILSFSLLLNVYNLLLTYQSSSNSSSRQDHLLRDEAKNHDDLPATTRTNTTHIVVNDHDDGYQPSRPALKGGQGTSYRNKTKTKLQNNFQSFNTTNPYNATWCPRATCHNSPLCSPCNKRFLFILATGRSGSTSLLKMMNKLPNVQLSGENNDELFIASRLESNLIGSSSFNFDEGNEDGAWLHNAVPLQAMACAMQKVMTTIDPPPAEVLRTLNKPNHPTLEDYERSWIFGAKMIRIQISGWNVAKAVAYFQENFPCSRYIVNYSSDIDGQINSRLNLKWGTEKYEAQAAGLRKENEFLKNFANLMGPDAAQLIDMNEWTHDVSIINNILLWMGYKECHFQKLLHDNNHGYSNDSSDPGVGEKCHYPHHSRH